MGIRWQRLLAAILWLAALASFLPWAARGAESNPPPAGIVLQLQYREADFAPLVWEPEIAGGASFAREPDVAGRRVFRGVFKLGADTNQFVPFLWDIEGGRLHLDLNRNRDLTDEPGGGLTASGREVQLFHGLRLPA